MTMIGNLAQADSDNKPLQSIVTKVFANTMMQAPSKNPQSGVECETFWRENRNSRNGTIPLYNHTGSKSGYTKVLVPNTNEPLSVFPPDWTKSIGEYANSEAHSIYTPVLEHSASQNALAAPPDPEDWLDGFYDDDLWWALAWINAYDITSNMRYLQLAEGIFAAVTKAWPTHCNNGGIYWSWEKGYANAIANELFLSTAAHLANRVSSRKKKTVYIDWADRTLSWFLRSGMINERGTINDGLTDTCKNNNQTTWSYNQGVILGALVQLNNVTPNSAYLSLAARIAKAAIIELSDENGVIHDVCEPKCGGDGSQFKGIFMRNLQMLHEVAPDEVYIESIQTNAESIWRNDRDEEHGNRFSVNWAGPFVKPANASTHGSAMDALVAAIAMQ
ncbi:Nn.00g003020.m01.CDS01 [Neocucurbitaria sp. VM-36]